VKQRNKYQKLVESHEKKREDAKRFAMAKIKATEKPFNFYKRDVKQQREKSEKAELPSDIPLTAPFRAGKIPWRVLVPLYQAIVDKDDDREKRVKKNAEISLSLSKLPPRMEAYEKQRKEKEAAAAKRSASEGPAKKEGVRDVPDFKRLHKEFAQKLLKNKGSFKQTVPQPFNFHENKNKAELRKYMDEDNQIINPTKKLRASSARINLDLEEKVSNPPTTKKHEAMVKLRREAQNKKLNDEMAKVTEEHMRAIKAIRLTNRVKKSPALSSNTNELKKKRNNSIQRARDQMKYLENVYNQQKAIMEFNVANRPLLVEQQTQEFINLYNQIRDLQKYVAILRNANLNPNDHLTEDQKILLQRAQYFDQLNQLAYFPGGIPPAAGEEGGVNVLDEAQQQQLLMLQAQQMGMPVEHQNQYQPGDHYERVKNGMSEEQMQEAMAMQQEHEDGEDEYEGEEEYQGEEQDEGDEYGDEQAQIENGRMEMDDDEGEEMEEGYDHQVDIDRQGEQQIIDDELGQELEGEEIDQELEDDDQMNDDQSPNGYENQEDIEEADQQVQQMMRHQQMQDDDDDDDMQDNGEDDEDGDNGEDDMYELDEE